MSTGGDFWKGIQEGRTSEGKSLEILERQGIIETSAWRARRMEPRRRRWRRRTQMSIIFSTPESPRVSVFGVKGGDFCGELWRR